MATVLVVDDHEDVLEALSYLLTEAGHTPIAAGSGVQGLDIATNRQPDVVLLDIAMPGMDGLETLRRLKANPATSPIPVIMVTANGSREYMVKAIQYGTRDYICKPWEDGEVEMVVRWAVNSRSKPQAAVA